MWNDVIEKYSKDIVSFNNQKAGTAIFYDTRGIHRAEPFQKGRPRTALFAQYADLDGSVPGRVPLSSNEVRADIHATRGFASTIRREKLTGL